MTNKLKFIKLTICFFIAYYLEEVINQTTLTTILQRVFVFTYFYILLLIFYNYLFRNKKPSSFFQLIIVLVLSLILVITLRVNITPVIYLDNNLQIKLLTDKNTASLGNEVWITKLTADNLNIPLNEIDLNDSEWIYKDNALFTDNDNIPISLHIPKHKNIDLQFVKHQWSGMIEITGDKYENIIDLYADPSQILVLNIPTNFKESSLARDIMLMLGELGLVYYILQQLISLIGWYTRFIHRGNSKMYVRSI